MNNPERTSAVHDAFCPAAIDDVTVHEVVSRYKPRSYIIIHPATLALEELGIKDYFLWQQMDGEKSLARIKQDYYQKFKILPTEHINDLIYRWLDLGFLAKNTSMRQQIFHSDAKRRHWTLSLPASWVRTLLGPLGYLFGLPMLGVAILFATVFSYAILIGFHGPLVFYDVFTYPRPAMTLIASFLCTLYGFTLLRAIVRLGVLLHSPRYQGDKLLIHFQAVIPFFAISPVGLKLKPWETRIMARMTEWVLPAFLSSVALSYCQFFPQDLPHGARYAIGILGLAGLTDLIIHACPFLQSTLVRVFDEVVDGFNTLNLVKLYMKSPAQFMEDRSPLELRMVMTYFALTFLWVIFGSSFLLFTTAKFAEGLTLQLKSQTSLEPQVIAYIQYALYAPIFMAFVFMLWKLVHPYYLRVKQKAIWRQPHYLTAGLAVTAIGGGMVYYAFPDLFARFFLLTIMIVQFSLTVKPDSTTPPWIKWGSIALVASNVCHILYLLRPDWTWVTSIQGAAWVSWSLHAAYCLAPKSVRWLLIQSMVTALAFLVYASFPTFMMDLAPDGRHLFLLSAAVSTGISIMYWGGGFSLFFGMYNAAMLLFFLSAHAPVVVPGVEAIMASGIFMVLFFLRGLRRFIQTTIQDITEFIHIEKESDQNASIELTLGNYIAHCLGRPSLNAHRKNVRRDLFLLNSYAKWVRQWVRREDVSKILNIGLTSVPWEKRSSYDERVPGIKFARLEQKSELTVEKRVFLLKKQLIFKGFSSEELLDLADHLEVHVHEQGQVVVQQDTSSRNFLEIIYSGNLLMTQTSMDGTNHVLAELVSGDAVRSEDLFSSALYHFSVTAIKDTITLRLYRNHLIKWFNSNPGFLERVMESLKLANMIMKLSLFRDFSPAQVRLVMEQLQKRTVAKGETIIQQGEEGSEFYLLDKGKVDILVDHKKIAQLGDGSYFGEIALLEKCLRTASVVASEKSTLYSLAQKDFERFFAGGRSAQVLKNVSSMRAGARE